MSFERTPAWRPAFLGRLAAVVAALALAAAARGQTFANWLSDDGTTVTGTIGGTSITFSRDANGGYGLLTYDGTSTFFDNGVYTPAVPFTPSLANSDFLEFHGRKSPDPVPTYTITFGTTVVDPILLFASNASTLTFSATPTFISGTTNATAEFIVSGNQVSGTDYSGVFTDASGTVKFIGNFTSLSFTAVYPGVGSYDGIGIQVGVTAIPEPSTYAALAGAAVLGVAIRRRRRALART